ncbi:TetR/AcrR family transcriptional regulator [Streptomyces sp. A012304]|uniref:TetR/AcrR family transcriptional regulator n=1 Tax=Streptomyces sp. A012304 TaxID=375446 RepID=UPI00222EA8EB|nr:TetR/AcrR family transcriptional regulator [Streptomyces sp. A012304]
MEIARAAAGLFVSRGLRATRAEDIAQAAGIAPRTFYRYFATKEEAVAPLYAAGAERWTEAVREAPAGLPLPAALEHAVRHTLTPGGAVSAASWEWVRTLIRLARTVPALGKVWAELCLTSEEELAGVLAERDRAAGSSAGSAGSPGASAYSPGASADSSGAGVDASAGAGVSSGPFAAGDPAAPVAPAERFTSTQRFTAAVASAAVRVAVESWAMADGPADGPEGPAELALRNLAVLRGIGWGEQGQRP